MQLKEYTGVKGGLVAIAVVIVYTLVVFAAIYIPAVVYDYVADFISATYE